MARINRDKCIGCDLCYIACWDGAHQCITSMAAVMASCAAGNADRRRAARIAVTPIAKAGFGPGVMNLERAHSRVDEVECGGCNLCWLVCPVENCITMERIDTGRAPESWRSEWGKALRPRRTMPTTLIRNGTVITANRTRTTDVLIEAGLIKEIRPAIPETSAAKVIDAAGMYVLPGGIDVHTHLDMPFGGTTSSDDFETGTRAAAFGGTTSIVDFAIQARGTRMRDALDTWWKKAAGRAVIDYGLHAVVTDLGACGWKTWTNW